MSGFLQNFSFDQISFWIGFIAGALGLWLITKLSPGFPQLLNRIRTRSRIARSNLTLNNVARLRQEILHYVQGLHLASPMFSLDEIVVESQILAQPHPVQPGEEESPTNILSLTIPYLPDWPELAARYSANTISLARSLSGGANLILTGHPGSGKTTALAHLVCQIVRRDASAKELTQLLPIYVHVADLLPEDKFSNQPLDHIITAISAYAGSFSASRLENVLEQPFQAGKVLLLVDGLDEVSPTIHQEVVAFLNRVIQFYPNTRFVVTATPENFSGLAEFGFIPVAMAAWDERQYYKFIRKWSQSWFRYIRPTMQGEIEQVDPRLLNAWLLAENPVVSPFEATLKAWSAFAGDTIGPGYVDAIESYIWRLTNHLPKSRPGLEDFALQMVASLKVALELKRARGWEAEIGAEVSESETEEIVPQRVRFTRGKKTTKKLPGVLPDLLDTGVLVERMEGRLGFKHSQVMAYLASAALAEAPVSHFLSNQPEWTGKSLTLLFLAASREISPEVSEMLTLDDDPLLRKPLMLGRWLHYTQKSAPWRTKVMRFLAEQLQGKNLALGLRARIISALLLSGDPGVSVLLKQISYTSDVELLQLSALGMGYLLDSQTLTRLSELLEDPEPSTFRSACLALVRIGNKQAFEALGTALLSGSEELRRSVAEALALDPVEGYSMLKEASQIEDLFVRRAAVFGLAQIDKQWAIEILEKLALEDQEWVVRSAATQATEGKEVYRTATPRSILPLHETPWLIAFASERGMGIAPGKPAHNLLLAALGEGSLQQQLAALDYLKLNPNREALPLIYDLLSQGTNDLQQAAYNTLWHNASEGLDLNLAA